MISAILIFNNHGKPRLSKFYEFYVSLKDFNHLILKPSLVISIFIKVRGNAAANH